MADQQTLLAHLALKLASHPENIAVEALGHILSKSPAAVLALEDVLKNGGAEIGGIDRVQTQLSDEKGSRPDLAGLDANGTKRLLIEAKFWAGLTKNQPVKYLEDLLKQDQPSVLLFVAPAKRFESLWDELSRLVKDANLKLVPGQPEEPNLRSAIVDHKCRLMLTSWTALLDRMDSRASTAGDSHTESDIQQLQGLAEKMDEEAFLPLRPGELGPEIPRRLSNLENLVDHVIERLEQKDVEKAKEKSQSHMLYGRYLTLFGAGAWFGLERKFWGRVRDTPLWLEFRQVWEGSTSFDKIRNNLKPLELETPPELFEVEPDYLVIPIYLPVGVEQDAMRDATVERIEEIGRLIHPAT